MILSDFSVRNPVKVSVGVILVSLFGLIALFRIPIQLTPEVTKPLVAVQTRWPGASPEEIEREIIAQQEEQLQDVEGMIDFRSESLDSIGIIEMEFEVGTNLDSTLLKVANKLDQVRDYPADADEPVIRTTSVSGSSIAYFSLIPLPPSRAELEAVAAQSPELAAAVARLLARDPVDVPSLYRLAGQHPELAELIKDDPNPLVLRLFAEDEVASRIAKVPGVASADVYGGSEEQLRVVVDPAKLAARRITIAELRAALAGENKDISAGDLWEGKRRYIIRTLGQYRSIPQVEDTIVAFRDGAPIYVKDIAQVDVGHSKPEGVGHQRGVNMITIAVQRQGGANVLEVMRGIKQAVAQLNDGLLRARGLQLEQSYDETVYIEAATQMVWDNMFLGGALAVLVLYLFLRNFRSTLVIALSIPISCMATFLAVNLAGRTINVVSLAGMAFAVGMVVDNAIVVLENIFTHYQRGCQPQEAASKGAAEVWGAVLASTATTVAVFLPVIFIQEEAGQLFRDIAVAISAGVSLSLIVSLTVVPAAAARMLRPHTVEALEAVQARRRDPLSAAGRAFSRLVDAINERLQRGKLELPVRLALCAAFIAGALALASALPPSRGGRPLAEGIPLTVAQLVAVVAGVLFLPLAIRLPRVAVVVTGLLLSIGLSYRLAPNAEYLPEGNKNLVFASLLPPPGYNLDQMMSVGGVVESRLRPYWEATPGTPEAEALDGPLIETFFLVARRGSLFMGARAVDPQRARELVGVMQRATEGLPGVIAFVNQASLFERNNSAGRTIDIEITGPDLEKLIALGTEVMSKVQEIYPTETTETMVRPRPSLDLASPEIHVRRNPEKASQRGVSTVELGYAIDALVDGAYAGTYWHHGREIDLAIYGDDVFARRTQDIGQLPIATASGELVRIDDVADVALSSGPEQIFRIDRQRAVTIQVRPGPAVSLEAAMQRIDAEVLEPLRGRGEFDGLTQARLAGTADDLKRMRSAMAGGLLLALAITYLLMSGLYESFVYPAVIMISVPLAAVGGFAGLFCLNFLTVQQLDSLTMLGFVILIGTVVNNAILIVDQALIQIRRDGQDPHEAVIDAARGRIRPIYMTTMTTVLGMLPLVLYPGAGSELYRGLGTVIIGGLIVSTAFTLFFVPLLFTLTFELETRVRRWLAGGREAFAPVPLLAADPSAAEIASETSLAAMTAHRGTRDPLRANQGEQSVDEPEPETARRASPAQVGTVDGLADGNGNGQFGGAGPQRVRSEDDQP